MIYYKWFVQKDTINAPMLTHSVINILNHMCTFTTQFSLSEYNWSHLFQYIRNLIPKNYVCTFSPLRRLPSYIKSNICNGRKLFLPNLLVLWHYENRIHLSSNLYLKRETTSRCCHNVSCECLELFIYCFCKIILDPAKFYISSI